MASLAPTLKSLVKSISTQSVDSRTLDNLVKNALIESNDKVSPENRKSQWEYLLKNEIFLLAATEGKALSDPETKYYDNLRERLDLVLTFTEHDACEATFPFIVLQDLLETQTISSCSHVFSWIESRATRLTKGMVPQKGKALILLRTLNDLLRRLSKMGSTTIFCGRILTFLSGVFPLGERSGVNLRGEYGPTWEGVKVSEKRGNGENTEIPATDTKQPGVEGDKMQVDETKADGDAKKSLSVAKSTDANYDFYNTFWSLQLPFSKPPLFAAPNTFSEFKDAVDKVLPAIKEATTKERAMMGSRSTGGAASLKRKREPETIEESTGSEYFFAKFLTSPDLLDLEIADTHFRRQFLFQLLILLNHLLTFTKAAKITWATPRNRSLQMDFTLDGVDAQWVQETLNKATDELRQTAPNGPVFKETVNAILEREKNWVKWKNELCTPFDREPWSGTVDGVEGKVGLEEATKEARMRMRDAPEEWKWSLGSESLTTIWAMGFRDLYDLQNPFQPGDIKDFVKKIKIEDARIEHRRKVLARTAERIAAARAKASATSVSAPAAAAPFMKDPAIPKEPAVSEPAKPEPSSTLTPPTNFSETRSPLHPSLPAKPGLNPSPSKLGSSQEVKTTSTAAAAPVPTPTPAPAPVAAPSPVPSVPPIDDQIARAEESKQRWSWLALRTARDQYLQHFGKIGTGDLILLQQEIELAIEKEKQEREKIQKGEESSSGTSNLGVIAREEGVASPSVVGGNGEADAEKMSEVDDGSARPVLDTQGDVRMEP